MIHKYQIQFFNKELSKVARGVRVAVKRWEAQFERKFSHAPSQQQKRSITAALYDSYHMV